MAELIISDSEDNDSLADLAAEALEIDLDYEDVNVPLQRVSGKRAPKTYRTRIPKNICRSQYDVKAESIGFHTVVFMRALLLGIPGWLFGLIFVLRRLPDVDTTEPLESIEFYAGRRTIQRAFTRFGRGSARALDRD